MEQSLFWTTIIAQLVKKYLANYGIRRNFLAVFTRSHQEPHEDVGGPF